MQIKYSIKFIIEKRKNKSDGSLIKDNIPINCEIIYKNNRLRYYVGHRIDFDQWDSDKQRVIKNTFNDERISSSDINKRITNIESELNSIFDYYIGIEKIPTPNDVKNELRERLHDNQKSTKNDNQNLNYGFFDFYDIYIKEAKVGEARRRQLKSTRNHFYRFNSNITFDSVNANVLKSFQRYLKNDPICNKGDNTVSGILKKLRAFFSYSYKNGWSRIYPFNDFKIEKENYGDPIFITKVELDLIYMMSTSDELLEKTKDLFVLQCSIGCRIGDYKSLTKQNVINGAIEYIPSKTVKENGRRVRVPLNNRAISIINKYKYPNDALMPFIPDQQYNDLIRLLFRTAGIIRNVIRLNPRTRKNEVVSIASIASSHMARRTFIGILHKKVKNEIIASMSGHVEDSKAFSRYYSIDDNDKKVAISILD